MVKLTVANLILLHKKLSFCISIKDQFAGKKLSKSFHNSAFALIQQYTALVGKLIVLYAKVSNNQIKPELQYLLTDLELTQEAIDFITTSDAVLNSPTNPRALYFVFHMLKHSKIFVHSKQSKGYSSKFYPNINEEIAELSERALGYGFLHDTQQKILNSTITGIFLGKLLAEAKAIIKRSDPKILDRELKQLKSTLLKEELVQYDSQQAKPTGIHSPVVEASSIEKVESSPVMVLDPQKNKVDQFIANLNGDLNTAKALKEGLITIKIMQKHNYVLGTTSTLDENYNVEFEFSKQFRHHMATPVLKFTHEFYDKNIKMTLIFDEVFKALVVLCTQYFEIIKQEKLLEAQMVELIKGKSAKELAILKALLNK